MANKLITIVGMGKGISLAIAYRFGREGYSVAMISRTEAFLKKHQKKLTQNGLNAHYFVGNAGNESSLQSAFDQIKSDMGDTDVLVYNAAILNSTTPSELTFNDLVDEFKVNVAGALVAVHAVVPSMKANKKGTIILTGGGLSIHPLKDYASLAIGKAGIKSLTQTLAQEYEPDGIHVATVTVCGWVKPEDKKYSPTAIAEQYWKLHIQPSGHFQKEIVY